MLEAGSLDIRSTARAETKGGRENGEMVNGSQAIIQIKEPQAISGNNGVCSSRGIRCCYSGVVVAVVIRRELV
jgi:hypothetical protein